MADTKGTITEDVAGNIALGQKIYDVAGERVGTVDDLDRPTGWMKAEINPFSDRELYIPFKSVTSVDPRELYLSLSRDELLRQYANPPARTTHVESTLGETVATTRQPSGYTGALMVVEEANVDKIRKRVTVGDLVLTSDQIDLGTIKRYDGATGWMMIGKGLQARNDLMVPITVVSHVDRDVSEVYLAASRADLRGMQHLEPVDVVFVDTKPIAAA
ncbi:MAG: hypothetical protein QOJ33_731 [Chloroflexota bacterium]|jgi:hypothetical protein|nr:hypothetical protein [Chloroflexota bacterium]MEA2667797.1 hypothetical protein [Chloroflexota bacterium]